MPIRIVSEVERNVTHIDGATFYYRRMPFVVRQRLTKQCTERGILNNDAYAQALLEYTVLGWHSIVDQADQEIPFSQANLMLLPEETMVKLLGKISDATATPDLGNSNGHVRLT